MASFNRLPSEWFDLTTFPPDQVTQELARIWRQIPLKPRSTHFNLNPTQSRLNDFNCLYFPTGFVTTFRSEHIRCMTLGQYIAIQFDVFVRKILKESARGRRWIRRRRRLACDLRYTDEHKANLRAELKQWQTVYHECTNNINSPVDDATWVAPHCASEGSKELLVRMGYEFLRGSICMYGRICSIEDDEGVEIRRSWMESRRGGWHALDTYERERDWADSDGELEED
ncbi:MAG: hypothetical protein LQ348_000538 [Seirophora lacunosa]|nr:MAG: hypothetical protein LQ348_000538 [Seirophora lacunosa]